MQVIYSIGARFAGGGVGNTSYHAVRGLFRHQLLARLICGSFRESEIPAGRIRAMGWPSRAVRRLAIYDRSNTVDYFYRVIYDRWAARKLTKCDIFLGWSGYCLQTTRRAKELGAKIVLYRALAHPNYLDRLIRTEAQQLGLSHTPSRAADMICQEIDQANFILTPSEFVNDTFRAERAPDENLILIPFGVDTQHFAPPMGHREGPFRALFVGHVSIRKGAHTLLHAWQELGWTNAELLIAGQMKLPRHLADRYRDLPGVHYLGHVTDIAPLYQASDVFVLPSLAEGSALVTYEAMACQLPLVVTPNAGSIARENIECLQVPVGDAQAIALCLERLRTDEGLRRRMGAAARQRVEDFTWEAYGDRIVDAMMLANAE